MLPVMQGRGALIVIHPDSTAELAWSSNNESIFGLALRDGHVLFSTDSSGRIFDLDPSRDGQKLTLVAETQESLATRLLLRGEDIFVTTSSAAKLIRISDNLTREGTYESSIKDTKFVSRWGTLAWRADVPAGASLELYVRSGNSEKPDGTWSDWTGPYRTSDGTPISSSPGRSVRSMEGRFSRSGLRHAHAERSHALVPDAERGAPSPKLQRKYRDGANQPRGCGLGWRNYVGGRP